MAERREVPRYPLSLPITVRVPALGSTCTCAGQTREVSTRGVYFRSGARPNPGDEIDVTITLAIDGVSEHSHPGRRPSVVGASPTREGFRNRCCT
jgi:hypothetical protein